MEDIIFMILVEGIKELGLTIDGKERHSKKDRNEIAKLKYCINEEEPDKTDFLITVDGCNSYIEINKHKKQAPERLKRKQKLETSKDNHIQMEYDKG